MACNRALYANLQPFYTAVYRFRILTRVFNFLLKFFFILLPVLMNGIRSIYFLPFCFIFLFFFFLRVPCSTRGRVATTTFQPFLTCAPFVIDKMDEIIMANIIGLFGKSKNFYLQVIDNNCIIVN